MWGLYGRYFEGGRWSETQRITGDAGPNLYHAVVRDSNGNVHVVWQGFRGGHSQILTKAWNGQQWSAEIQVSTGTADSWVPAVAADGNGNVWVGWDSYDNGNFDIFVRKLGRDGKLEEGRQVTRSAGYDATSRWPAIAPVASGSRGTQPKRTGARIGTASISAREAAPDYIASVPCASPFSTTVA